MLEEAVTECYSCAQGLYSECLDPLETPEGFIIPCAMRFQRVESSSREAAILDPSQITDAKSTGRKRAAMLAPIMSGMLCEWAGLRQAGGGPVPIVGCAGNQLSDQKGGDPDTGWIQGDRHHGPDKATINNALGTNLHRICVACHHRWHTLNDPFYGERETANQPFLPLVDYYLHDANTEATVEEQELVEAWWATSPKKRNDYPVVPNDLRTIHP